MTFDIKELGTLEEVHDLAALFARIWGRGEPAVSSDILKALSHSGGYLAGGYQGGQMTGGLIGWLGGRPPQELHLHSHILGVVPGKDARGFDRGRYSRQKISWSQGKRSSQADQKAH